MEEIGCNQLILIRYKVEYSKNYKGHVGLKIKEQLIPVRWIRKDSWRRNVLQMWMWGREVDIPD